MNSAIIGCNARVAQALALRLISSSNRNFHQNYRSKFVSCSFRIFFCSYANIACCLLCIRKVTFGLGECLFSFEIIGRAFSIPIKSRTTPKPDTKETECGLHRRRCQGGNKVSKFILVLIQILGHRIVLSRMSSEEFSDFPIISIYSQIIQTQNVSIF